ncbi:MAG: T9SS C-terminal target domain-containing protein [Pelagibacteraceae bacterium TMED124]|nr:hypothetical protein [Candidatus Neomarinimicrobiota bacterium]RPG19320.1 MAG: T9SS C-terminal target domain-containing protein [Pelagibacteraceae bacterium TMED124]|tara:strand:- start:4594 stop:5940 length:1347 start_codon:yes stop_codon:yes gene_type:complete
MDNIVDNWMNPDSDSFHNHVVSLTHLDDMNLSSAITDCQGWGNQGSLANNTIIDDGPAIDLNGNGYLDSGEPGYDFIDMLGQGGAFPSNVFIDHTMTVVGKNNNVGAFLADMTLQSMLDDCEPCNNHDLDSDLIFSLLDNCPNTYNPDQIDADEDGFGDTCDDCHNKAGDPNDDFLIDVSDIIIAVQAILSGGMNSENFNDCQKSDLDLNNDFEVSIMDIIEIIRITLGLSRDISLDIDALNQKIQARIVKEGDDTGLYLISDTQVAGIQLTFESNKTFDVELIDNSHIGIWSENKNGKFTMLSFDKLFENRVFDSNSIYFKIKDSDIGLDDVSIIAVSESGRQIQVDYSSENQNSYNYNPEFYGLSKIYPNPFNPSTEVEFILPRDGYVELLVYDLNGREVGSIFEGFQTSGLHSYQWKASNLPSGVYYVRFQFENNFQSMKAVLMK